MTRAGMSGRWRTNNTIGPAGVYAALQAELQPGATRRPHVCFVAPGAWPAFSGTEDAGLVGGAGVQLPGLARALARLGYRVSVVCSDHGQPPRAERDGVTLIRACRPGNGAVLPGLFHPCQARIWLAMRKANADIYCQSEASALTALVAMHCRLHGKRSIFTGARDRDFMPGLHAARSVRWLFRRGLAMVDAVVTRNNTQQALCAKHYDRTSTLIPDCYEAPADAGLADCLAGKGYVLWVAPIRQDKRPELLLGLARRLPHRHFVMIGGPASRDRRGLRYYDSVRQEAGRLPNLDFLGGLPLADAEPCFDHAALVINTAADGHGMANEFLRAWARGKPTIALSEAGAQAGSGTFYPVVPHLDAAASAIDRMYTDELHRARVARRCREHFRRNHCCETSLAQFRQLLDTLYRGGRL